MEGRPGFVIAPWCGAAGCEAQIKTDTQATIRNMPIDGAAPSGTCVRCDKPAQCGGVVREELLEGQAGLGQVGQDQAGSVRWSADRGPLPATFRAAPGERFSIRFIDRVPPRQLLAADDRAEGVGEMLRATSRLAPRVRRAAIASRHEASPTIDSAARNSTGSGVVAPLERFAQVVERQPAARGRRARRARPRAPSSIHRACRAGSAPSRSRTRSTIRSSSGSGRSRAFAAQRLAKRAGIVGQVPSAARVSSVASIGRRRSVARGSSTDASARIAALGSSASERERAARSSPASSSWSARSAASRTVSWRARSSSNRRQPIDRARAARAAQMRRATPAAAAPTAGADPASASAASAGSSARGRRSPSSARQRRGPRVRRGVALRQRRSAVDGARADQREPRDRRLARRPRCRSRGRRSARRSVWTTRP